MKTYIYHPLILLVIILVTVSCENELPFNIKDNPPKLVMNAFIKASILENNANAPFAYENCEYSEDALEVLKSSALMQQIPDKEFILKLLQAYKGCRKINEDNKDYYKYKQDHITRYLSHQTSNNIHKNYNSIYEVWAARLQEYDIKQLILTMPNTFNENPFTTPQKVIKETIELINQTY